MEVPLFFSHGKYLAQLSQGSSVGSHTGHNAGDGSFGPVLRLGISTFTWCFGKYGRSNVRLQVLLIKCSGAVDFYLVSQAQFTLPVTLPSSSQWLLHQTLTSDKIRAQPVLIKLHDKICSGANTWKNMNASHWESQSLDLGLSTLIESDCAQRLSEITWQCSKCSLEHGSHTYINRLITQQ